MLAGASAYIAGVSRSLYLACRHPHALAEELDAQPIHLDWTERSKALEALEDLPDFDLLLTWLHQDGLWLVQHLERLLTTEGRSIRVHGSTAMDARELHLRNGPLSPEVLRQNLILGWIKTSRGRRWLSHTEISAAAIELLIRPAQEHLIAGSLDGMQTGFDQEGNDS